MSVDSLQQLLEAVRESGVKTYKPNIDDSIYKGGSAIGEAVEAQRRSVTNFDANVSNALLKRQTSKKSETSDEVIDFLKAYGKFDEERITAQEEELKDKLKRDQAGITGGSDTVLSGREVQTEFFKSIQELEDNDEGRAELKALIEHRNSDIDRQNLQHLDDKTLPLAAIIESYKPDPIKQYEASQSTIVNNMTSGLQGYYKNAATDPNNIWIGSKGSLFRQEFPEGISLAEAIAQRPMLSDGTDVLKLVKEELMSEYFILTGGLQLNRASTNLYLDKVSDFFRITEVEEDKTFSAKASKLTKLANDQILINDLNKDAGVAISGKLTSEGEYPGIINEKMRRGLSFKASINELGIELEALVDNDTPGALGILMKIRDNTNYYKRGVKKLVGIEEFSPIFSAKINKLIEKAQGSSYAQQTKAEGHIKDEVRSYLSHLPKDKNDRFIFEEGADPAKMGADIQSIILENKEGKYPDGYQPDYNKIVKTIYNMSNTAQEAQDEYWQNLIIKNWKNASTSEHYRDINQLMGYLTEEGPKGRAATQKILDKMNPQLEDALDKVNLPGTLNALFNRNAADAKLAFQDLKNGGRNQVYLTREATIKFQTSFRSYIEKPGMSPEDAKQQALADTLNFINNPTNWTAPPNKINPNSSIDREATTGILGQFNEGQIYKKDPKAFLKSTPTALELKQLEIQQRNGIIPPIYSRIASASNYQIGNSVEIYNERLKYLQNTINPDTSLPYISQFVKSKGAKTKVVSKEIVLRSEDGLPVELKKGDTSGLIAIYTPELNPEDVAVAMDALAIRDDEGRLLKVNATKIGGITPVEILPENATLNDMFGLVDNPDHSNLKVGIYQISQSDLKLLSDSKAFDAYKDKPLTQDLQFVLSMEAYKIRSRNGRRDLQGVGLTSIIPGVGPEDQTIWKQLISQDIGGQTIATSHWNELYKLTPSVAADAAGFTSREAYLEDLFPEGEEFNFTGIIDTYNVDTTTHRYQKDLNKVISQIYLTSERNLRRQIRDSIGSSHTSLLRIVGPVRFAEIQKQLRNKKVTISSVLKKQPEFNEQVSKEIFKRQLIDGGIFEKHPVFVTPPGLGLRWQSKVQTILGKDKWDALVKKAKEEHANNIRIKQREFSREGTLLEAAQYGFTHSVSHVPLLIDLLKQQPEFSGGVN